MFFDTSLLFRFDEKKSDMVTIDILNKS